MLAFSHPALVDFAMALRP